MSHTQIVFFGLGASKRRLLRANDGSCVSVAPPPQVLRAFCCSTPFALIAKDLGEGGGRGNRGCVLQRGRSSALAPFWDRLEGPTTAVGWRRTAPDQLRALPCSTDRADYPLIQGQRESSRLTSSPENQSFREGGLHVRETDPSELREGTHCPPPAWQPFDRAAVAGAAAPSARGAEPAAAGPAASPQSLPMGKLGDLEVSRILLGGQSAHALHPQPRPADTSMRLAAHVQHRREDPGDAGDGRADTASTPLVIHNVPAAMRVRSTTATVRNAAARSSGSPARPTPWPMGICRSSAGRSRSSSLTAPTLCTSREWKPTASAVFTSQFMGPTRTSVPRPKLDLLTLSRRRAGPTGCPREWAPIGWA